MLKQTERALTTPLPRVFDTEPGTGKPIPSAPAVMGTEQENVEDGVRVGQLDEIANTTGYKLEQEVLAPMEQWLRLFQASTRPMGKSCRRPYDPCHRILFSCLSLVFLLPACCSHVVARCHCLA